MEPCSLPFVAQFGWIHLADGAMVLAASKLTRGFLPSVQFRRLILTYWYLTRQNKSPKSSLISFSPKGTIFISLVRPTPQELAARKLTQRPGGRQAFLLARIPSSSSSSNPSNLSNLSNPNNPRDDIMDSR